MINSWKKWLKIGCSKQSKIAFRLFLAKKVIFKVKIACRPFLSIINCAFHRSKIVNVLIDSTSSENSKVFRWCEVPLQCIQFLFRWREVLLQCIQFSFQWREMLLQCIQFSFRWREVLLRSIQFSFRWREVALRSIQVPLRFNQKTKTTYIF